MSSDSNKSFPNNSWHDRLANKWGLSSKWQFWLIFIAFALSGSTSSAISTYLLVTLHQTGIWPTWQLIIIKILLLLIIYPPVLFLIGSALGQYKFFSSFLLKPFRRK
jgi:hypothetical protein